jgi:GNAT superfamily N-acetyltransferase
VPTPRRATKADLPTIGDVFGRAFLDDPVLTYVLPDLASREKRSPRLWRTIASVAIAPDKGEVWITDSRDAAAVWLAPNRWKDRPKDLVRQLPLLTSFGRSLGRGLQLQQLMQKHHPREPHWYLQTLGTDPSQQGKGLGSALLAPVLERCDHDGIPAYLESSKAANIPFYERHGFRVTEEMVLPDGPTIYPMWRDPELPA